MAKRILSVNDGVKLATRHPGSCAQLLANNLYPVLEQESWFSKEWRLKFCAYFLLNLVDHSIEEDVDPQLLARIKKLPLNRALKLIENSPCSGLKVLVAIISERLRMEQKLSLEDQYVFYNSLFGKFFPDCKLGS